MICSELMTKSVASCHEDDRVDTAAQLMCDRNVGALVVVGTDNHPVGIITDRDLALAICAEARDSYYVRVNEIMRSPVVCCRDNDDVTTAVHAMTDNHVRRLPVVNRNGELVGIISVDDLARSPESNEIRDLLSKLSVAATVDARP